MKKLAFNYLVVGIGMLAVSSCNSGGTTLATNKQPLKTESSVGNVDNLGVTIRDNDVYLNNSHLVDITGFNILSYHVTDGQPWDGVSVLGKMGQDNGLQVKSGRKGNLSNSEFLWSYNIPTSMTADMNFAVIGDLYLSTPGDSQSYICKKIALAQAGFDGRNVWIFYSNRGYDLNLGILADRKGNTIINCTDIKTNKTRLFNVSSSPGWSTLSAVNRFDITPNNDYDSGADYLNQKALADQIMFSFSSLSVSDKAKIWANDRYHLNPYDYSALLIVPPNNINLGIVNAKVNNINITQTTQHVDFVGCNILKNTTAINQTMQSSAYSKTVSQSLSNTNTWGTEVGVEFNFPLEIGKMSVKASYKHDETNTTSTSETYTAPSQSVLVPARSIAYVKVLFSSESSSGNYSYIQELDGNSTASTQAIGFLYPYNYNSFNGSYEQINVARIFKDGTIYRPDLISVDSASQHILIHGGGSFSSSQGTNMNVDIKYCSIDQPTAGCLTTQNQLQDDSCTTFSK